MALGQDRITAICDWLGELGAGVEDDLAALALLDVLGESIARHLSPTVVEDAPAIADLLAQNLLSSGQPEPSDPARIVEYLAVVERSGQPISHAVLVSLKRYVLGDGAQSAEMRLGLLNHRNIVPLLTGRIFVELARTWIPEPGLFADLIEVFGAGPFWDQPELGARWLLEAGRALAETVISLDRVHLLELFVEELRLGVDEGTDLDIAMGLLAASLETAKGRAVFEEVRSSTGVVPEDAQLAIASKLVEQSPPWLMPIIEEDAAECAQGTTPSVGTAWILLVAMALKRLRWNDIVALNAWEALDRAQPSPSTRHMLNTTLASLELSAQSLSAVYWHVMWQTCRGDVQSQAAAKIFEQYVLATAREKEALKFEIPPADVEVAYAQVAGVFVGAAGRGEESGTSFADQVAAIEPLVRVWTVQRLRERIDTVRAHDLNERVIVLLSAAVPMLGSVVASGTIIPDALTAIVESLDEVTIRRFVRQSSIAYLNKCPALSYAIARSLAGRMDISFRGLLLASELIANLPRELRTTQEARRLTGKILRARPHRPRATARLLWPFSGEVSGVRAVLPSVFSSGLCVLGDFDSLTINDWTVWFRTFTPQMHRESGLPSAKRVYLGQKALEATANRHGERAESVRRDAQILVESRLFGRSISTRS